MKKKSVKNKTEKNVSLHIEFIKIVWITEKMKSEMLNKIKY